MPHWNAFVATLEMHGVGRFFDPRLNDPGQFPIAAAHGFGDLPHISPDDDRVTGKLSDLQFYQLAIASPRPPEGSFDAASALWSDPGWNLHTPAEVCIDEFQANRAPDRAYRTSPLGALFTHRKGGFYHDGRFPTLEAVVDHYNACMQLALTQPEKSDLVQYLLSLTF